MLRLLHLFLSKVYLQPLQLSSLQPFHLQLFHHRPHLSLLLKQEEKYITTMMTSLLLAPSAKQSWWRLNPPKTIKGANHRNQSHVFKKQQCLSGREPNPLAVVSCTNESRLITSTTKWPLTTSNLTSGCTMPLQMNGIFARISASAPSMMILILTARTTLMVAIMTIAIHRNSFRSPEPHCLHYWKLVHLWTLEWSIPVGATILHRPT